MPLTCTIGAGSAGLRLPRRRAWSSPLCAHLLSCVVPLWKFGNDEQKRRYLPGLCDGTLIGVHAMTEPGSGSDAFALAHARGSRRRGFRINGTKTFISNAPEADLVIVFAVTDLATRGSTAA